MDVSPLNRGRVRAQISSDNLDENWRNGPAKRWYDMLGLPSDCQYFDYGFELNRQNDCNSPKRLRLDSEDAFLLVSQINWERNVIWDSDAVRQRVMKSIGKPSIAGWIPIEEKRTAPDFFKPIDENTAKILITEVNSNVINNNKCKQINDKINDKTNDLSKLNSKTLRKRKVQFCNNDIEEHSKKPEESVSQSSDDIKWVSTLHEENRELALKRWEDDIIWDPRAMSNIPEPKIIPFSSDDDNAIIDWSDSDENSNDSNNNEVTHNLKQFSLNISNDEFYASVIKAENSSNNHFITHSIPAIKLHPLCFPSWDHDFFRPVLKRSRKLMPIVEHTVLLCNNQDSSHSSDTQNTKDLSKYLIKNIGELTARNGNIVLMEYSEESPPLLMRVGMGSQLFNYFKKTQDKNYSPEEHRFALTKAVTTSPFIGEIGSGKSQLALENNMFRSPIWEHSCPGTDFLIIRTEDNYYIREIDGLFVVGQTLPLIETPRLKSKPFYDFCKQFAKMFIYQYFDGKKTALNLESELQKAFPNLTKNMISIILKLYTERIKYQSDRFRLKSEIPFDNQINDLLTPENCCAYYSSAITAATTLKEMGVGDRLYLNNDDNECDKKIDELWFAPWNTTLAYIASINAKKMLNVNDYNEDGSIIFRNQSYKEFKDQMPSIKRCLPLTERSINRLTLIRGREWLINYGMSRDKVKRFKNLKEIQELIRDLSDSLRESGVTTNTSKTKNTEQYYKIQCQKVFDLHSRFYSKQDYETDESDDEEEEEVEEESDSDIDTWGQDLEAMILENKSLEQIQFEREEKERKEWMKEIKGQKDSKESEKKEKRSFKGKILKISRTYERDGKKFIRHEIVRNPKVIDVYTRIRETKSEDFIRQLSLVKNITESGINKSKPKKKTMNGVLTSLSENASNIRNGFINNTLKEIESIDIMDDNSVEENESLVRVDGSKLRFSKQVVIEANQIEAEEQLKIKQELEEEERSKQVSYFVTRSTNRVRVDPMVRLKDIFDSVIVEVRKRQELDENIDWFMEPIREKDVPDYYEIITNPMDLQTIRQNIRRGKYSSREEFLKDIRLIYENSLEYNGEDDITADAKKLLNLCEEKLNSMSDRLEPLELMLSNGRVS